MEHVTIGTKVKPLGINRTNVADGITARVVLLDPNPCMKYIGWDDVLKRKVELNQEMIIKYNFKRPVTCFYYLVCRLNTDMNGKISNNQFVIEYLQLSENLNNELSDAILENPDFTSFKLSKVSKKGPQGQDFSYIKVTPSNFPIPSEIQDDLAKLRSNESLAALWTLVDKSTSISPVEYEALRKDPESIKKLQEAGQNISLSESTTLSIEASKSVMPSSDGSFEKYNDFDSGDDFNSGF